MQFGFSNKARCPIGIDFGTHSLKMIQLERRDTGYAVAAAAARPLPAELPSSPADRAELMAGLIKQMLATGGFTGRRVVSSPAANAIQYKNLRLPRMPMDELPEAIKWEAADRLKLNEDQASIQYFDAGEVRQGEELRREIILLAATHVAINEHIDALTRCELEPVAIDAVPSALARCLTFQLPPGEPGDAHVVLDVGYTSSKVLIVRDGEIAFFKLIDIGGQKLNQSVAQHLSLPIADAAELRKQRQERKQLPAPGDASTDAAPASSDAAANGTEVQLFGSTNRESIERAVLESTRATAGELAKEVALCLRYYSVTFRGARPTALLLLGGEAHEPQLARVLTEGADIQAQPIAPLAGMDLTAVPDLAGASIPIGSGLCEWAVAAGLSMRKPAAAKRGAA